jgi:anti-sigma-K factor RskA
MIPEQQQERASLYALDALAGAERDAFERELRASNELRIFVRELQRSAGLLAMTVPQIRPPQELRSKVLERVKSESDAKTTDTNPAGFRFADAADPSG